jgi:hypothetical protein
MREHVMGRDEVIELVLVALARRRPRAARGLPGLGQDHPRQGAGRVHRRRPAGRRDRRLSARAVHPRPAALDITGVMVFDTDTSTSQFRRGPLFAHVLLVDEINRTSPKVQSALLEAMAEKQVTVDNISHRLDELFFVHRHPEPARRRWAPTRCRWRSSTASSSSCAWSTSTARRARGAARVGHAARLERPAEGAAWRRRRVPQAGA